jgi:hypothetical protein
VYYEPSSEDPDPGGADTTGMSDIETDRGRESGS